MKVGGWILLIFSLLSFIGAAMKGNNVIGPVFWGVLAAYLISRAKKKKQEEKDKDKWTKESNS